MMHQHAKKACDSCRRRKIKCQGDDPCYQCLLARLKCTYYAIPQKKGPKSHRQKLSRDSSNTQQQTDTTDETGRLLDETNNTSFEDGFGFHPNLTLLRNDTIQHCIDIFYDTLYDRVPILDRQIVREQVHLMGCRQDSYCLVLSLCAVVLLGLRVRRLEYCANIGAASPASLIFTTTIAPDSLVEQVKRVQEDFGQSRCSATLNSLAASYLIFAYYHTCGMHSKAWYHLRKGTTMICLANMDVEDYYLQIDAEESSHGRNIYWLYYSAERYLMLITCQFYVQEATDKTPRLYALQHDRPLTLQSAVERPRSSEAANKQSPSRFDLILNVFWAFDGLFLKMWVQICGGLSQQRLSQLSQQFSREPSVSSAEACISNNADGASEEWLTATFWQLSEHKIASSQGLGNDEDLDKAAKGSTKEKLAGFISQFPGYSVEMVESCFVENLLITTYWVIKVLSVQQPAGTYAVMGNQSHLDQILDLVTRIRQDQKVLPLLLERVNRTIPDLISPIL